jgi:DNA binding domain, excisionase family
MGTTNKNQFMTVVEVANLMRVKPLTVYRLLNNQKLPAVKFGNSWRIHKEELYKQLKLDP